MLIRIPVPGAEISGTEYAIEFDSGKIDRTELQHEVVNGFNGKELTGRSSLILHFATRDDAPKWVEMPPGQPYVPNTDDPGTYVTMTQSEFADWSQRHGVRWEKAEQ